MSTITRWDPFFGLNALQREVNQLFEGAGSRRSSTESGMTAWAPAVDIYENGNELVVKADIPEIDQKDLDIRVENNLLTIHGERKFEKSISEESYLRVERAYGSFSRSFTLPNTVNTEAISAQYANGVLTLHLPKREEAKPKQIQVKITANNN